MDKLRVPAVILSCCLVVTGGGLFAREGTDVLPISVYIDALPSVYQFWGDPASGNSLSIDAYGKRAAFFGLNVGTTVTGAMTVRDLGDGMQQVTINIHSHNAICWGANAAGQYAFGYTPRDVFNSIGKASLGDALTTATWTQPAGPVDLSQPWESSTAVVRCDGELRFGSGEPDGTPGFAETTQVARFNTGVPAGCPPETDANCFPAEKVRFQATGR